MCNNRQEAIKWWKTLSLDKKSSILSEWEPKRDPRSLTGREVETLYEWNVTAIHTKPSRSFGTISFTKGMTNYNNK